MSNEIVIPATFKGQRLDKVLVVLYPDFSRTQLSSALKAGHILIDGHALKPKDKVQGGEAILFTDEARSPRLQEDCLAEDIPLQVLYEDEFLLILNKPADLVVHPGAGNRQHTLVNALLFYHPPLETLPRAGIVHRLDKDTTGLLLVAKKQVSYRCLVEDMKLRHIQRYYLALVHGRISLPNTLRTPFGRDPKNRVKMAVRRDGKEAITSYLPLRQFEKHTLLKVQLETGRTHQIRVHMAHLRHPIVGDPLYCAFPSPLLRRQALHAYRLEFIHPITKASIALEAELPEDFQHLLNQLSESSNRRERE